MIIAQLQTEKAVHPGVTGKADLVVRLTELVSTSGLLDQDWWMLTEQSNGYVVAHKQTGAATFTFTGTAVLNPALVFDGRLFSSGIEVRFALVDGVLTTWKHTARAVDDRVPDWVSDFVAPVETAVLTRGPDAAYTRDEPSGFTHIRRGNGQRVTIPVPFDPEARDIRLILRRHYSWDDETGRVWVSYEAPDRYERRS